MLARWRMTVFLSITIGYTIYYVTRLPMSVAKNAMIDGHVLTVGEAGVIDSVFLVTYAIGKTVNGFIADRVSVRRLFASALLVSAIANVAFGASSLFVVFVMAWAVNGWVQSVGVPASGVVMANWFESKELGTRYSIWSMAHHLGEGLTFLITARLVSSGGWRAAFIGPAVLGLVASLVLYRTIVDRPAAIGLPAVAARKRDAALPLAAVQREVLTNPWLLLCGLASGLVYVSRYAINNWGVFYLQNGCGYTIDEAGVALSIFPITGIAGTLLAGPISDRIFGGRRVPVALAYGVMLCIGLAAFYMSTDATAIRIALACAGFAMGGLLVFLGGLIAMELCSQRAAGAALGVIGGFSYLGAGLQSLASSRLIAGGATTVGEVTTYDFGAAKLLWLGAPIAAVALTALLWRGERAAAG